MEETQVGIGVILFLLCLAGFSVLGLVFLHSRRSGVCFRAARSTEPPLWGGGLVLAVLLGYQLLMIFFMGVFSSELQFTPAHLCAAMLLAGLVVTLIILWNVVFKLRQPPAVLGICGAPLANLVPVILFTLLIIAPIMVVSISWALLLQFLGIPPERQWIVEQFSGFVSEGNYPELALMVLGAVVLAPLWEELIFRGLFLGLLRSHWGAPSALVFTSLVFSAYHFSLSAFLPLFFTGIALGYVYIRTRSIYFAILAHAVFNGVMLLLEVLLVLNPDLLGKS